MPHASRTRLTSLLAAVALATAAPLADAAVDPGTGTTYETRPVTVPMTLPVAGRTSFGDTYLACRSGCARKHMGQDLMSAKMTPLVAAFDGVVSVLQLDGRSGNTIGISADRGPAAGWTALYLHVNNDRPGTDDGRGTAAHAVPKGLAVGSRVLAGQLVGWLGDSGNAESTGAHLHFELRRGWGWGGVVHNAYPSLRASRRLAQPLPSGPHPVGTLVRPPTGGLFLVVAGGKRRVPAELLGVEGRSAATAVPVTAAESLSYPTLGLLRPRDGAVLRGPDGQRWLVTGGRRAPVDDAALTALHRPRPRTWPVTQEVLGLLPVRAVPETPWYAGALVRQADEAAVHVVGADGLRHPVGAAALASHGWTSADVAVVPSRPEPPVVVPTPDAADAGNEAAEEAGDGAPEPPAVGAPAALRDGTLLQTFGHTVAVVSGGVARRLHDARQVAAYGYSGRPRLLLPGALVAGYPWRELTQP